jgi:hypothetical protein
MPVNGVWLTNERHFQYNLHTMATTRKRSKPVTKKTTRKEAAPVAAAPVAPEMPPVSPRLPEEQTGRINPWSVAVTGLILIALVVGGLMKRNRDQLTEMRTKTIPAAIAKLAGTLKLKEVRNLKEVSGLYEFEVVFDSNGTEQKYTSYITKDGKIVFTSGAKVAELGNQPAAPEAKKLGCSDLVKADGVLTAFVVSNCPYGLQMQRAMKMAIDAKPDLAKSFAVKYIGSIDKGKIVSMHGDKEAAENLRQICIRDEQADKYWSYVSCYMKAGDAEGCATSTGVNTTQLASCTADAKRGLAFAQKDFDLANKYNVSGSPTLLSNGSQVVSEYDFGGRTPDALKQLVCCASKDQPEFCKTDLSKDAVATAFSLSDAAAQQGSANSAASCGN